MHFLQKNQKKLLVAAFFVACFFVFAVFWQLNVRGTGQKSRSVYLNDEQSTQTSPVTLSVQQTFTHTGAFHALGILPFLDGAALPGKLKLDVFDESGTFLASAQGNAAETATGQYAVFAFSTAINSKGGVYKLVFTAQMQNGHKYALIKSNTSPDGWSLQENGQPAQGALCLLASVDAIGSFASRFYLAFTLFSCFALSGLFYLHLGKKLAIHKLFALCALVAGFLFCFIIPPYAALDEASYINKAFSMSSALFGQKQKNAADNSFIKRTADNDVLIEEPGTTIFTYRELSRKFLSTSTNTSPAVFKGPVAKGGAVFSLPGALGLYLARVLGLGFVPALYFGRFFSLAAFVFLASLAVKITPIGKSAFSAGGLLPLGLSLAASYNILGLVLATCMLCLALCLAANKAQNINAKSFAALLFFVFCLASCGITYLPVALLFPFVSCCSITAKGATIKKPKVKLIWGIAFFVAFGIAIFANKNAALLTSQALPQQFAKNLRAENFIKTLLGGVLGTQNLYINWALSVLAMLLLAFAVIPQKTSILPKAKMRVMLCLIPALCLFASALLGQNHLQAATALTPVLPFLLCGLVRPWCGIFKTKNCTGLLLLCMCGLCVFTALNAFLIVITR